MKLCIAGSRGIAVQTASLVLDEWAEKNPGEFIAIKEIVSGRAEGVDMAGEAWGKYLNKPIRPFPADWQKHDKAAGPLRNAEMAEYADALLAIWDGTSRGTLDCIQRFTRKRKPVWIEVVYP